LKAVISLIKKDYKLFFHDKPAVSLTFLVPAVLIFLFGSIFGGSSSAPTGIHIAFVNNSESKVAHKLESVLDTTKAFMLIKEFTNDEVRYQFN